ncbi:hypothetical protein [Micromonospora sagamiensis]|uniref:Uncharacterized protein n=1 Tax=Micromonospora sagamiensis TaxID=47875 RepID=A0A562WDI9_9ACTN|nr:hypothetical protein [Micromonospora sagamiensis]TWJ28276.1 hypothetical protein JD81_01780 [Micromonospora sagamiensis]BCL12831.1 hypothetical protein GCM10017556_05700 [Micromonospora sagamiensis]
MTDRSASAVSGQRNCALYRFWVRHPETGERALGYIGETGRLPFQRLMEHIYQQPWADTILAWEVDPITFPHKASVLAAERRAIETELPLYNVDGNLANPGRIPPGRAVLQRQARDPGWVQPQRNVRVPRQRAPRTTAAPRPVRRTAPPSQLTRWWRKYQTTISVWAVLWLLLWAVLWWLGRNAWTGWEEPRNAAILASIAWALALWGRLGAGNRRPPRRTRARKRTRR